MLKDGVIGGLTEAQKSPVQDIFNAGTHLLSLINDVLDLSMVEAGKLELELEAVTPRALLEASLVIVRERAINHRITLVLEAEDALPGIALDPRRVKQILYNLLSNAVKFMGGGGTVTLSASRVNTRAARGLLLAHGEAYSEFIELAVRDTGTGMPKEDLSRLFRPFVQLDSPLARKHEGTGLGLALVKGLANLHGGTVGVVSEPGKGSTFSVWLPWRQATPAARSSY